jgi:hypothetical protein
MGSAVDRDDIAVAQKNLSLPPTSARLSTRAEVPRKTHLTFFVSKEIIQLVTRH